jgi:hypothetical protein
MLGVLLAVFQPPSNFITVPHSPAAAFIILMTVYQLQTVCEVE